MGVLIQWGLSSGLNCNCDCDCQTDCVYVPLDLCNREEFLFSSPLFYSDPPSSQVNSSGKCRPAMP